MADESKLPTILACRDALSRLVDLGLGEFGAQVLVVPASTMIAVVKATGDPLAKANDKPPLMIEFDCSADKLGPSLVSVDYLNSNVSGRGH